MSEEQQQTFEETRARLEEILVEVRSKDTSLERSLELLEEGVTLANRCNELIDQTSWRGEDDSGEAGQEAGDAAAEVTADAQDATGVDGAASCDDDTAVEGAAVTMDVEEARADGGPAAPENGAEAGAVQAGAEASEENAATEREGDAGPTAQIEDDERA